MFVLVLMLAGFAHAESASPPPQVVPNPAPDLEFVFADSGFTPLNRPAEQHPRAQKGKRATVVVI